MDPISGDSIKKLQRFDYRMAVNLLGASNTYTESICFRVKYTIWVDVYVPKDVEAGIYKGSIKVIASENISSTIPVTLEVWDFALPDMAS